MRHRRRAFDRQIGQPRQRLMKGAETKRAEQHAGGQEAEDRADLRAPQDRRLLVILDDPDSLEEVVLWFHQASALTMMSQNGALLIGDEMKALLPRYFTVFFDEIRHIAPGLADVLLVGVPKASKKHLN